MSYTVIAIEREYASGGSEIGEKLAEKLGIPCYGQEILEMAAEQLNMSPEELRDSEENMTGSFLYSMAMLSKIASGSEPDYISIEQKLIFVEADIIRKVSINPCIIVGRGAAALFKDKAKVLKVFIHSDYNARTDRTINVYGTDPNQADSVLHRCDKRRSHFFKVATNEGWKDQNLYHLFLNSGKLGIEQTINILYTAYSAN